MAFQELLAGIWMQDGGPALQARTGLNTVQFQQAFNDLTAQGFRLTRLSGYAVSGEVRYAAIWEQDGGAAFQARDGLTGPQLQQTLDDFSAQGFRLTWISGFTANNQDLYAAIWEQSPGPAFQARFGLTTSQFQQTFNDLTAQNFRLRRLSGYSVNGDVRYAAIWAQDGGPAFQAKDGLTAPELQQAFDDLTPLGFRVTGLSAFDVNNQDLFAAIWEQDGGPAFQAKFGLTTFQFQQTFDQLTAQGFRLRDVSGYEGDA